MLFSGTRSTLRNLNRLRQIASVLARHGFAELADRLSLRRFIPILRRRAKVFDARSTAQRAADVLQELGPTFVKLGQALSQRPDLLPEEYLRAFERLQDRVKPLSKEEALSALRRGLPPTAEFREFEEGPLASGSIAQAHAARLHDGRAVVVKIRRPGIESEIESDLALLAQLAELAERHIEELRLYRPTELVAELARTLRKELDFTAEAAAIARFGVHFRAHPDVVIPDVIWSHSSSSVLTLTRVEGVPLSDTEGLSRAGVDRKKLAKVVADCFLRQFFEIGIFHADPHPGNLFACDGGRLGLLDFGAVGHLSEELVGELATILYALSVGDMSLIASVYEELGAIAPGASMRASMLADFQEFFDRWWGLPSDRMDFFRVFADATEIARRYDVRLPRELVLFGRALVSALSTVQRLDPAVKVSEIVRPYAGRLLAQRFSPSKLSRAGVRTGYHVSNLLRDLPGDLRGVLRSLRHGDLTMSFKHEGLEDFSAEIDRASNRLAFSVIIAAIIIGSSFIMTAGVGPTWRALEFVGLGDVPLLGLGGFLVAGVMGFGLAWTIYRSGKLGG